MKHKRQWMTTHGLKYSFVLGCIGLFGLCACSPVSREVTNEYKLNSFSTKRYQNRPDNKTILVSMPQASAGYKTAQMLYVKKPYELAPFAKNAWVDAPASMLFPLLVQSLEQSNSFRAVTSSPYAEKTDYRLDTQLIELQQNFLKPKSVLQMSVLATLTNIKTNTILGTHIFRKQVPCSQNNPLGGVLAANIASEKITGEITNYVIKLTG